MESSPNSLGLTDEDVNAIKAQVPTLSRIVAERVLRSHISSQQSKPLAVTILATDADYELLLRDRTGAAITAGRFISKEDLDRDANVIVLSESLSHSLHGDEDAIGRTLTVKNSDLTVIGLVGESNVPAVNDVVPDAYVPIHFAATLANGDGPVPTRFDRVRCKVESLDQIEATRNLIQEIMRTRRADGDFRVR